MSGLFDKISFISIKYVKMALSIFKQKYAHFCNTVRYSITVKVIMLKRKCKSVIQEEVKMFFQDKRTMNSTTEFEVI